MLRSLRAFSQSQLRRTFTVLEPVHPLNPSNFLTPRHLGPDGAEISHMLSTLNLSSLDELTDTTLPSVLKRTKLPEWPPKTEQQIIAEAKEIGARNQLLKTYIGCGYYGTYTPPVILRNVMENPAWYTSYTPYQAEISQGRMESLLNYQTMVSSLTGLEITNASLLDEATAAAEAMVMAYSACDKKRMSFFLSERVYPQTKAVIQTRAAALGIKVVIGSLDDVNFEANEYFGVLAQSPDNFGEVRDFTELVSRTHAARAIFIVGSDLLALTKIKSPGEMGADIAYGNSQRFGVPMGYGGPHAAFFSAKREHLRRMPGRIIGVTRDSFGNTAYHMTIQTREQHIRREKATSNICTAQALLANMAAMYGIYHGPVGLLRIADRVNAMAYILRDELRGLGYKVITQNPFDTLILKEVDAFALTKALEDEGINIRRIDKNTVGVSLDETTTPEDAAGLVTSFARFKGHDCHVDFRAEFDARLPDLPASLKRTTPIMTLPIFNSIHSESQMLRYMYRLQLKDISLANSMIPLGSCTMKLNSTVSMIPVTFPEFGNIHPFVPARQALGYEALVNTLRTKLIAITGMDEVSFQPNSGAAGEYAGLITIMKYHEINGQSHRKTCLIPVSAHGTNPASAALAGMKVVVVQCDKDGNISLEDLKLKAEQNASSLGCLMMTYPSTHGVFESSVHEVTDLIHSYGGQVYMDGANMNAQVGLISPGDLGADVCHLNLHKTFSIPHGGGGPGMGPICVKAHLAPYLPYSVHEGKGGIGGQVSGSHWASASILLISWAYIEALGTEGLIRSTQVAILNANYIAKRLSHAYEIVYTGQNDRVAHELILDLRPFKQSAGITEEDVVKRLIDFGFHGPTMSWPIPGTVMIEPTESEDKGELDRLCEAFLKIREEIAEIEGGRMSRTDNVLKNAPHTLGAIMGQDWTHPYTREQAVFPLPWIKIRGKFWPTVGRIDKVFGDKNPVCSCPDIQQYV
jgi:glycine dehydrogenase